MSTSFSPKPIADPSCTSLPADVTATRDRRGRDCLLACDLIELARTHVTGEKELPDHVLAHVLDCPYCKPRFESQVALHQLQPAQVDSPPAQLQPALDSWSGRLAQPQALAADGGPGMIAAHLTPLSKRRLADYPLYLELRYETARAGKLRCQVIAPALTRSAGAGTPQEVLDKLNGQQFLVELTGDDWHGGCGFGAVLNWNAQKTALVSAQHLVPASNFYDCGELVLTHLQAVVGHDLT